jgi:hypothetical protein
MDALVPSPAVSPAHMMAAVGDLPIKEEHDGVVTCDGSYPIPGTGSMVPVAAGTIAGVRRTARVTLAAAPSSSTAAASSLPVDQAYLAERFAINGGASSSRQVCFRNALVISCQVILDSIPGSWTTIALPCQN